MSSFIATVSIYSNTFQIVYLKAKTLNNATQEAFDRVFCNAMDIRVPADYAGSPEEHAALMQSVSPEKVKAFIEGIVAEKRNSVGDVINAIKAIPSTIRVIEVFNVHPCDKTLFHQEWCQSFHQRYHELTQSDKQDEIQRLKQKMAEDAAKLKALEGSK
jgi:hypothetical protein